MKYHSSVFSNNLHVVKTIGIYQIVIFMFIFFFKCIILITHLISIQINKK